MPVDPTRLRTLRQCSQEAPAFSTNSLRYVITNRYHNHFERCLVRVG